MNADSAIPAQVTANERAGETNPLEAIRSQLPFLSEATARVAEWILARPEDAGAASITTVSRACGSSPASVSRLAIQLGYSGFPALRAAIAKENGRDVQAGWESDFGRVLAIDDPPGRVLSVLASAQANALRNVMASVDLPAAARVADALSNAPRIHVYGEWGDGIAARELYVRLLRIGLPVWEHEGPESVRAVTQTLGETDVAVVVSREGTSTTAEEFLRNSRRRGALGVVITGVPESAVGRAADICLFTGTRPGANWNEYVAGRLSDSVVANFLVVLVAQRVPDETRHPYTFSAG